MIFSDLTVITRVGILLFQRFSKLLESGGLGVSRNYPLNI